VKVSSEAFGTMPDGTPVERFSIRNQKGTEMRLCAIGATITELLVPDKAGNIADVVLGFSSLADYIAPHPHFGCMVGRVANRIAGAKFELAGKVYSLDANDGPNCIHGGKIGLGRRLWHAKPVEKSDSAGVEFTCLSPDGEGGFPGSVDFKALYTLDERSVLRLEMSAIVDAPTPINLTNHTYFNLHGAGQGNILAHELRIPADFYTPADAALISTGEVCSVTNTPLDFRNPKTIGKDIAAVKPGYDHNYVLASRFEADGLRLAGAARDTASGRTLQVYTTQPAVQLYTGNFLDGSVSGIGGRYMKHGGICLETQHFPDAVHHSHFPSTIVEPSTPYRHIIEYRLGCD
jgi:aldose 1-epimerase